MWGFPTTSFYTMFYSGFGEELRKLRKDGEKR